MSERSTEFDYRHLGSPDRKEIEAVILARLERKSTHDYQWPRWAAAEEASYAAMDWLDGTPKEEVEHRPARGWPEWIAAAFLCASGLTVVFIIGAVLGEAISG